MFFRTGPLRWTPLRATSPEDAGAALPGAGAPEAPEARESGAEAALPAAGDRGNAVVAAAAGGAAGGRAGASDIELGPVGPSGQTPAGPPVDSAAQPLARAYPIGPFHAYAAARPAAGDAAGRPPLWIPREEPSGRPIFLVLPPDGEESATAPAQGILGGRPPPPLPGGPARAARNNSGLSFLLLIALIMFLINVDDILGDGGAGPGGAGGGGPGGGGSATGSALHGAVGGNGSFFRNGTETSDQPLAPPAYVDDAFTPPSSVTLKGEYAEYALPAAGGSGAGGGDGAGGGGGPAADTAAGAAADAAAGAAADAAAGAAADAAAGGAAGDGAGLAAPPPNERGKLKAVFISRPTAMRSVRLAVLRLELSPRGAAPGAGGGPVPGRSRRVRVLTLSGLDFRDVALLNFQGLAAASALGLAPRSDDCRLVGSLRFAKPLRDARSARTLDLPRLSAGGPGGGAAADDAGWGVAAGDFGPPSERHLAAGMHEEPQPALRGRGAGEPAGGGASADSPSADIVGVVTSPDCGVRIEIRGTEIDLRDLKFRVWQFAALFAAKGLLALQGMLLQMRRAGVLLKVSRLSLCLQIVVDCWEAYTLLISALEAGFMSGLFVSLAVLQMVFITCFELRYLVAVTRARFTADLNNNPELGGENSDYVSQRLTRFARFHAAVTAFVLIALLNGLAFTPWTVLLLFFFWLPQILSDVWKNHRNSVSLGYVFCLSLARLVYVVYLWGATESHTVFDGDVFRRVPGGGPNWRLVTAVAGVLFAQVAYVSAQRLWGPRAGVNFGCLPPVVSYYDVPVDLLKDGSECVICMCPIPLGPALVATPCQHVFHDVCLERWLEVKLECPTCRRQLPPFD